MRYFACALAVFSTWLTLTVSAAAEDWMNYSYPDLGFEALFPTTPRQEDPVETDGVRMNMLVSSTPEGVICLVVAAIYPEIPSNSKELEASRDNFVKGVEGSLISSAPTTFSAPGKLLDAMIFDVETSAYKFRGLLVIDGLRVYGSTGGVPKTSPDESALDKCVQGLKLLS